MPDYLFGKQYSDGRTTWIAGHIICAGVVQWAEEFKAPKKHSSDVQLEEQQLMRNAGWTVIADTGTNGQADIDAFKRRIDKLEATSL